MNEIQNCDIEKYQQECLKDFVKLQQAWKTQAEVQALKDTKDIINACI